MPLKRRRKWHLKQKERQRTRLLMKQAELKKANESKPIMFDSNNNGLSNDDCDMMPHQPDPTGWFHLDLEIPGVSSVMRFCKNTVYQGFNIAKDMIFPSMRYKRELTRMKIRLMELEQEIETLEKQRKKVPKKSDLNLCDSEESIQLQPNRTQDVQLDGGNFNTNTNANERHDFCCQVEIADPSPIEKSENSENEAPIPPPVPSLPPLPPPPPPPPPPGPPPPISKVQPLKFVKKKPKNDSDTKKPAESLIPVVTLSDLKNIKLKKVVKAIKSPKKPSSPVTTPTGSKSLTVTNVLKKRPFRRNSLDSGEGRRSPLAEAREKIPQEVLQFQNKLRKCPVDRSPGGTPMNDKEKLKETGDGLTPVMTRALRKKFKFVRSPSPNSSCDNGKENEEDSEVFKVKNTFPMSPLVN